MTVNSEIAKMSNSARERFAFANQFFAQERRGDPQVFIDAHERWLKEQLGTHGVPVDDRTWSHFYENGVSKSLGQKGRSLWPLERVVGLTVSDVLQALAWYYSPETSSWQVPQINIDMTKPYLVDDQRIREIIIQRRLANPSRWHSPMDNYKSDLAHLGNTGHSDNAKFKFTVNEHYENVRGSFNYNHGPKEFRGLEAIFDFERNILRLNFSNPNDFMGWFSDQDGPLTYKLTHLNRLLADLVTSKRSSEEHFIAIGNWRAY